MLLLHAIILGLVEGLTEFLPVSSTAHLLVVSRLLGVTVDHSFEIAIQSGAILAIVAFYIQQLRSLVIMIPKIVVAMIPTIITGVVLYPYLKTSFYDNWLLIGLALLIGGIIMILIERYHSATVTTDGHNQATDITWRDSFLLGLCQAVAIIPGVSRSGATIIGGRLAGINRMQIVQFSFLLGAPTILAATVYDLYQTGITSDIASASFVVAFIVSAVSAFIAVRWFVRIIERGSFVWFGWYRIIIGVLILYWLV